MRQILVPTANEARDVRRRLQKDPKSFEVLARTHVARARRPDGGLMGTFSRGPAARRAGDGRLRPAPPGRPATSCRRRLGYHVLRVDARARRRGRPRLEECRDRIRTLLLAQKSDRRPSANSSRACWPARR